MLLFLKITAKHDEYGRHACASARASGIDHAISLAAPTVSYRLIDPNTPTMVDKPKK